MKRASRWYSSSALKGLAAAVLVAGFLAVDTVEVHAQVLTPERHIEIFQKGVDAFELGDYRRAYDHWEPLAREGDAAAQRNIGHLWLNGLGVQKDAGQAVQWFRQAAELGEPGAQAQLGLLLLQGNAVAQDIPEAAHWLDTAARGGNALAQYNLALMYDQGFGIAADRARALGWYYLAASQGHDRAIRRLAALVREEGDPALVYDVTRRAPEPRAGDAASSIAAIVAELGGKDGPPDVEGGASAPTGAVPTQTGAGLDEMPEDDVDAPNTGAPVIPRPRPAVQADAPQQQDLAVAAEAAMQRGDVQAAVLAWRALARRGDPDAMYSLGRAYDRGEGVEADPAAAYRMFSNAANQGHTGAAAALADLRSRLGPEGIEAVEARLR